MRPVIAKERTISRPRSPRGPTGSLVVSVILLLAAAPAAAQAPPPRLPAPWTAGATPPTPIAGIVDVQPHAPLEFSRAWLGRVEGVLRRRAELSAAGLLDGLAPRDAARLGAALAGTLRVPVIPIHYADGRPPFPIAELDERLFGPGAGDTVSYAGYFREVSGGLLRVEGDVSPWIAMPRRADHYLPARDHGWGSFGRIVELRDHVLLAADRHVDYGAYDNDGPDGIPNSGDDDGFVDLAILAYATPCPGPGAAGGIWPHRAAMPPLPTDDPAAGGGTIAIADYIILPAVDPASCGPLHVGVLAHETGHALGLPDLYDYDGSSRGIGPWGLMGTGSHAATFSPAHPSAWEKEQLGWVTVRWLTEGSERFEVPAVERHRTVFRFDVPDEAGRYVLIENRQRLGSDAHLPGRGLLVWRVDPERGELGAWNRDERAPALTLLAADGRDDLGRGLQADSSDPYPGANGVTDFAIRPLGALRLSGIRDSADAVLAHLSVSGEQPVLVPRPGVVRLTALPGAAPAVRRVDVERAGGTDVVWRAESDRSWLTVSVTGDTLGVVAAPGALGAGMHRGTVHLRGEDGLIVGRVPVELYVAHPGVGQIVATALPWSWGLSARDGRILQASYGWDPLGLRPRPRVLSIREGETHASTAYRIPADALFAPALGPDGEGYVVARARDENYLYRLERDGSATLLAGRVGEGPAYGTAAFPDGTLLVAEWSGRIHRIEPGGQPHLWADLGTNLYQIAGAADGTVYGAALDGHVVRIAADGTVRRLETGFARGRLVAVAAGRHGEVFAAERGGAGRILRITPDGGRHTVFERRGAAFYGLAVDGRFLYALDLSVGELLRVPVGGPVAPLRVEGSNGW